MFSLWSFNEELVVNIDWIRLDKFYKLVPPLPFPPLPFHKIASKQFSSILSGENMLILMQKKLYRLILQYYINFNISAYSFLINLPVKVKNFIKEIYLKMSNLTLYEV